MTTRTLTAVVVTLVAAAALCDRPAQAIEGMWNRTISYQNQTDLFYNFYEGPDPSGATAAMYVSPGPIPPNVGHTYVTYQPFMPHEYLYRHHRSHYTYNPGAGWTRTKVRYGTRGLWINHWLRDMCGPVWCH